MTKTTRVKILPLKYATGERFIALLMKVLKTQSFDTIETKLAVPAPYLRAYALHERVNHDVLLRLHHATGLPMKTLALGKLNGEHEETILAFTAKNQNVPAISYLKGQLFVDKLLEVTGCDNVDQLSACLDVSKVTLKIWREHDKTSHELMVRLISENLAEINDFICA